MTNGTFKNPNKEAVILFLENKTDEEVAKYNFRLEDKDSKSDKTGIIGFKNYRNESPKFDCDRCELAMSVWCLIVGYLDNVKSVIGYKDRVIRYVDFNDEVYDIETDTSNSLETDLNQFIRKVIQRKYGESWYELYTSGKGIKNGKVVENIFSPERKNGSNDRDIWILEYFKEVFDMKTLTEEEIVHLKAYNDLAQYVHTIGNFIIGPLGFNFSDKNAKSHCNDRMDIFLKRVIVNNEYTNWKNWYLRNGDGIYIDYYFKDRKVDWDNDQKIIDLKAGNITEWSYRINNIILERGKEITRDLRNNLKSL